MRWNYHQILIWSKFQILVNCPSNFFDYVPHKQKIYSEKFSQN